MENNKKSIVLPLIIFTNLFPLYGVINYNWTIFSVVYIYWIELLIISTFQLLKILFAKGDISATIYTKFGLAGRFFIIRTGLFLFYLLFIVLFLGLLSSSKNVSSKDAVTMYEALFFKGSFYKITLLSFILYNLVEFLVLFILNEKYKTAKPIDNYIILDTHIVVVHIVVVLGTFLYQGVTEKLHWNHKSAMIACVSLFVLVKIIADIIRQSLSGDIPEEQKGKYI